MTRNLNAGRLRLAWLCLLLAAAPVWGQGSGPRAILRIRLPADARLVVEGQETKQTGPNRRFTSPPLTPGKKYNYTFEWTYRKDGKPVTQTRIVYFRAGENKEVDLTTEEDQASDKKKPEPGGAARELDVPFVPTPQDVVDTMLKLAVIEEKDVVYDLGCGDGRIVITAAKKYGCKAIGFDLDPERVKESRENVKAKGVEKLVKIEKKDLFEVDLKPASVVTLYLLPDVNEKLIPQLEQLKPGTRILSHDFTIKGIEPKDSVKVTSKEDGQTHMIYVWIAPLKKK
ncbi:MAG TPA: TIGR03000 domain-containing protein [Gemmataceae bacterium]|jgi:uncharacterized protein (TIGR03000 family)